MTISVGRIGEMRLPGFDRVEIVIDAGEFGRQLPQPTGRGLLVGSPTRSLRFGRPPHGHEPARPDVLAAIELGNCRGVEHRQSALVGTLGEDGVREPHSPEAQGRTGRLRAPALEVGRGVARVTGHARHAVDVRRSQPPVELVGEENIGELALGVGRPFVVGLHAMDVVEVDPAPLVYAARLGDDTALGR